MSMSNDQKRTTVTLPAWMERVCMHALDPTTPPETLRAAAVVLQRLANADLKDPVQVQDAALQLQALGDTFATGDERNTNHH